MLKFLDYKVRSAEFKLTPEIAANTNYKISPKISCQIKRGADKLLVSFDVQLLKGSDPLPFEFSVSAVGSFSFDTSDDPAALTIKAAETVYPFVRSSVATLTQMANIPPYMLPLIDMSQLLNSGKTVTVSVPNLS